MDVIRLLYLCFAILMVSSGIAHATLYMTYESLVTYESNTSGYDYGIHAGDVLTHVYLINKSQPGTYNLNATQQVMPDSYYSGGQLREDAYYSQLINGALLSNPLKSPYSLVITDDRYSIDYYNEQGIYYRTISWAGDDWGSHLFNVYDLNDNSQRGLLVYHYRISDTQLGEDRFLLQTINFQISETPPNAVPIPGAIWLLGSGLIGLMGIRRKLKK